MDEDIKHDLLILIVIAVIAKAVVVIMTTSFFHSFVDTYDLTYYLERMMWIAQGKLPYLDFSFDYPVMAIIPMYFAYLIASFSQSVLVFIYTFQFLMGICDAITICCIYMIARKIWDNNRAFKAGLLYAISLSVAYFTMTKFDAFPVALMMIAVMFTVYYKPVEGYCATLVGYLVKVFPVIILPFTVIWNAKERDLKKEVGIAGALAAAIIIPFYFFIGTFPGRVGLSGDIYANTPAYLIHTETSVLGFGGSITLFSDILYVIAGITFLWLAIVLWKANKEPVILLQTLLCAIFIVVFVAKIHSPQYAMWYVPFFCLLVSGNAFQSGIYLITQMIAYCEFPLLFGKMYDNVHYINPILAIIFFTIQYSLLIYLLTLIIIRK